MAMKPLPEGVGVKTLPQLQVPKGVVGETCFCQLSGTPAEVKACLQPHLLPSSAALCCELCAVGCSLTFLLMLLNVPVKTTFPFRY